MEKGAKAEASRTSSGCVVHRSGIKLLGRTKHLSSGHTHEWSAVSRDRFAQAVVITTYPGSMYRSVFGQSYFLG